MHNILYIEDDLIDVMAFKRHFEREKLMYEYDIANTIEEAISFLNKEVKYDLILSDYQLPDGHAIDVLNLVKDVPVIIVTGAGDEQMAVNALKNGAYDYITKDPVYGYLKVLPHTIQKAISHNSDKNKLITSEKRYRQLVESANDIIYESDTQGRFLFVNKLAIQFTGYSEMELLSMSIYELIDDPKISIFYKNHFKNKAESTYHEFELKRKDGSKLWVGQNIKALYDQNQEYIIGYFGVARDISHKKRYEEQLEKVNVNLEKKVKARTAKLTEIAENLTKEVELRHEVENQLRRSRQDYIDLFNNAQDAIIIFNPKNGRILETNDYACKMYGYEKGHFLGNSLFDLFIDKNEKKKYQEFIIKKGQSSSFETVHKNKNGDEILIEVNASKVNYSSHDSIITINRDITKRKLIEQKHESERKKRLSYLIDGQEMERKRLSRDLHDGLGQLLTGAKLYVNKLSKSSTLSKKDNQLIEEIKELLDLTVKETRQISQDLIPNLLYDFGLDVALKQIVKIINDNSEIKAKYKIVGEPQRLSSELEIGLYRIIQETVNNSIKHSNATQLLISLKMMENDLELKIKDNGKGFETKEFLNVDNSNVGNGLHNIKQRAEILNLEFSLHSIYNKGTTIYLRKTASS